METSKCFSTESERRAYEKHVHIIFKNNWFFQRISMTSHRLPKVCEAL